MDTGFPKKWKIFVGNRVILIQEETVSDSWRHVPTQSNLLTSFQEELNLQHYQHAHYDGREKNGFLKSHPAGLQQRPRHSQTNWKSEMCILHVYKFQKTSHNDFPS